MPLTSGSRLGPYEVLSAIGAGGMGEVYRARDTRLQRDVALKILPELFAADPDRLARFEREAQLLASLNHPNIGAIYGIEEASTSRALVLELIEGPTLADRIARGAVPLDEALTIARQISDALVVAHEHGVIHRDLKPANIKVRPDGTVKVLDFGLAKLIAPESNAAASGRSQSPTLTSPAMMTGVGMLLGTAAYMSPEQAKGQEADRRADVWAFGCVLFEMLAGRAAFDGHTTTELLANVLKTEPDWGRLPPGTPEAIRRLLRRCLQKDAALRLRDAGDARLEIDEARSEGLSPDPAAEKPRRRTEKLAWLAAGVLGLIATAIAAWAVRPMPSPSEVKFDVDTPGAPDPLALASLAVSPDGLNVVFVADLEGQPHLWVRSFDSVESRPLLETAGAFFPFWSADSRSIAFYAGGLLKRIDLAGGLVRSLTKAGFGFGGAWNGEGTILFVSTPSSPILRIPAESGIPMQVTRLEAKHSGHAHPHFLPDGRHFLYFAQGSPEIRGVYVSQIDGPVTRKLFDADSAAVYASGHLLFIRRATLFAQPFDTSRLETTGREFSVAEGVTGSMLTGLSATTGGTLAFRLGSGGVARQLVWVDRSGSEIGKLGDAHSEKLDPSLSPDGSQLAFFGRVKDGNTDVWLLETRRGVLSPFTDHAGDDIFPVWSRDGSRIAFTSLRESGSGLYQKRTTGTEREELLLALPEAGIASDWSPGDQILLYQREEDLWALPMRGEERKPFRVTQTEFEEREGRFSSDGKWLAYVSNSSGGFEVYVQPFPGPGQRVRVSTGGGAQVRWRPDGRELFYIALDGKLMAVPIELTADGQSIAPGIPVPLFTTHVGRVVGPALGTQYVVSADGKQFLMGTVPDDGRRAPIRLIANWKARP